MPSDVAPRGAESSEPTYLEQQIETLRLRLLDLSRRNPLVSTKDGDRYHSLLRVVDELPDELLARVTNGAMECLALPSLDVDPKDENTPQFKNAAAEARRTDRGYLEAPRTGTLFGTNDDAEDEARERALKDRVRASLGMPPRQSRGNLSLQQHAQNNGINPSYDLPLPDPAGPAEHHRDNFIQTLLFQDDLERRLNAIIEKNRSWEAETGVAVLRLAFGFLEWVDPNDGKISLAPLVLLPVTIERRKGRGGYQYLVAASAEVAESNAVIAKKTADEFGVVLPVFEAGDTLEAHFSDVASAIGAKVNWRVRRRVVVGVFPSQEIAMYEDLDTSRFAFGTSDVLDRLINGSTGSGVTLFAEDQDEASLQDSADAPLVVTDADSSQLSAVHDVTAAGMNVAIEGPPGSGKSQTIVNIIAAALYKNKKVLFIAEKAAALDVVRSRLEAAGLGDFVLSMLPTRSNRKGILDSVRARLELTAPTRSGDVQRTREKSKRHRDAMSEYLCVMALEFADTGINVHEILGRAIAARDRATLDQAELDRHSQALAGMPEIERILLRERAQEYAKLRHEATIAHKRWRGVTRGLEGAFAVGDVKRHLEGARRAATDLAEGLRELQSAGVLANPNAAQLAPVESMLRQLQERPANIDLDVVRSLSKVETRDGPDDYVRRCRESLAIKARLGGLADNTESAGLPPRIRQLHEILVEHKVARASAAAWSDQRAELEAEVRALDDACKWLDALEDTYGVSQELPLTAILAMYGLLESVSPSALELRSEQMREARHRQKLTRALKELDGRGVGLQHLGAGAPNPGRLSPANLVSLAEQVADKSVFRMFKSSHRLARKHAAVVLGGVFPGTVEAPRRLRDLADAMSALAAAQDAVIELMNGAIDARVVDEVMALRAVLELFEQCDSRLARASDAAVRDLVVSAPSTRHAARPALPGGLANLAGAVHTTAELRRARAAAAERAGVMAAQDGEVRAAMQSMDMTQCVETSQLPALALSLEQWHVRRNELIADPSAIALFGHRAAALCDAVDLLDAHVSLAFSGPELTAEQRELICAHVARGVGVKTLALLEQLQKSQQALRQTCAEVAALTGMDTSRFSDPDDHDDAADALSDLIDDEAGLVAHTRLQGLRRRMAAASHFQLLEDIADQTDTPANFDLALACSIDLARARDVWATHGAVLQECNGIRLDKIRQDIRETDLRLLELSREELRGRLIACAQLPEGNGRGRRSEWTEMSLLNNELNKERRLVPPRDLTRRAGKALLELKPCWMMSPLSVAQYTDKDILRFDLVIIDEASQMTPEHAIGALARGRQAVVVGDTNQLPPSDFFRKMAEEEDDDDGIAQQSILEWANMTFRPRRRLKWHYRSRHSALIAFSNHHVYGDELVVFPSANEARVDMGVRYQRVQGNYVSGSGRTAGTNPAEATAMVDAIAKFMREDPGRSLGVVVMNKVQRDLIEEEIENRVASDRAMSRYIEQWEAERDALEPFFVKNLENVQGDERDVIFIGTVYGPTEGARTVRQQFGPVNRSAGKRRLNVLFTRARELMVTFSSMDANDVGMDDRPNEGRLMLRNWLEYCATGHLPAVQSLGAEAESPFESHVAERIRALGFEAIPQVGVGKFRIDIGVQHGDCPNGFLIGVECDGASYHSSRSARDRDRLRQDVLEKLGWRLYRIWSTDWFENPVRESQKLAEKLEESLREVRRSRGTGRGLPLEAQRGTATTAVAATDVRAPDQTNPPVQVAGPPAHDDHSVPTSREHWRPPVSVIEMTRLRPDALRRFAEHVSFLRHFDRADQEFLLRIAKERALDLPLSYRDSTRLGRMIDMAAEIGIHVQRG